MTHSCPNVRPNIRKIERSNCSEVVRYPAATGCHAGKLQLRDVGLRVDDAVHLTASFGG